MIEVAYPAIAETARIAAPAAQPQALTHDGEALWVSSWETGHVYGLTPGDGGVFEEHASPGKPVGATMVGEHLRFVVSENGAADNRLIRTFVPGNGFTDDAHPCPDDTGSFLAHDGAHLWLSQRYNKRALELDTQYAVTRTLAIGAGIMGMAWCAERLYFTLWLGRERGGSHIGYIVPEDPTATLQIVAHVPFVAVALAREGFRLWTNDVNANAIVAFTLPE